MPLLQLPGRTLLIIFSNLFSGSKFRNASNIKLFPLLISFSSSQAHSTFVIPSPYSLHVLLGHQTWSLSSVRQFSHVSRVIPFGSLISMVHLSAPLCPQAQTLNLLSTCLMVCSILGSRPIFFRNLFLLSSPLFHATD